MVIIMSDFFPTPTDEQQSRATSLLAATPPDAAHHREPTPADLLRIARSGPAGVDEVLAVLAFPVARRRLAQLWTNRCPSPVLLAAASAVSPVDDEADLDAAAVHTLLVTLHTRTCPDCRARLLATGRVTVEVEPGADTALDLVLLRTARVTVQAHPAVPDAGLDHGLRRLVVAEFYRRVIDADPALAGRAGAAWRQALGVDLALARQQAGDHASAADEATRSVEWLLTEAQGCADRGDSYYTAEVALACRQMRELLPDTHPAREPLAQAADVLEPTAELWPQLDLVVRADRQSIAAGQGERLQVAMARWWVRTRASLAAGAWGSAGELPDTPPLPFDATPELREDYRRCLAYSAPGGAARDWEGADRPLLAELRRARPA